MENTLDNHPHVMTNMLVIKTKEFSMKPTPLRRLAYLALATILYAPICLLLLSRTAAILA